MSEIPKLKFGDENKKCVFEDLHPKLVFADEYRKLIFDVPVDEGNFLLVGVGSFLLIGESGSKLRI